MMNPRSYLSSPGAALLLLLSFAAGCGSSSSDGGGPPAVSLGAAGNFVILTNTGITSVPSTADNNHITGNVGCASDAGSITGFALALDASGEFSTSPQVTGNVYAFDYADPTPADLTAAVGAMEAAYTDAAGRAADFTELGEGNIGGMNLAPGVYKYGTGLLIPTNVTLHGNGVWIFQIAGNLTLSSNRQVILTEGALPKNVFWQVAGTVDIGTGAHLRGVVLSQTNIAVKTGAVVDGRLFAQTEVAMDGNTVVQPAQ